MNKSSLKAGDFRVSAVGPTPFLTLGPRCTSRRKVWPPQMRKLYHLLKR